MDLATIIGIIAAFAVVGWAIWLGGDFLMFYDMPSIAIVFGGGAATVLVRFPLMGVIHALGLGGKVAFTHKDIAPRELIEQIGELADVMRKQGPLGLETVEITNATLAKGVQMIADGFEVGAIRDFLERELDQRLAELEEGARVFKAIGDSAPAFGMIGTLVGLVQMLANMSDPSKIGPSMAVALLTTLYGAMAANVVALPIFEKLNAKAKSETVTYSIIIDGVVMMREGKNPNVIREMLLAYLPSKHRGELADAA
ncbi:MAG: MotA/TolQ/ExbB proton channel family protein [Hyphomicrobiaceae bacterium]|nr:MotA/TolQ/ExbB proton channel family protein [Hyphomicrobiaceae bacterium]